MKRLWLFFRPLWLARPLTRYGGRFRGPRVPPPRGGQEWGRRSTGKSRSGKRRQTHRQMDGWRRQQPPFQLSVDCCLNQRKIGVDSYSGYQWFWAEPSHGGWRMGRDGSHYQYAATVDLALFAFRHSCAFIPSATTDADRNTHQRRNSKCYETRWSALVIKMLGKCVFVCVCVWRVGGCGLWGNRVQENHIHMVEQLRRAPFSVCFYPQHQPQIPHHPQHTQLMRRKIG